MRIRDGDLSGSGAKLKERGICWFEDSVCKTIALKCELGIMVEDS
jgi:hypothetical protein